MKTSIKTVKITDIKLNPDNPRTITGKKMTDLVKSLTSFPEMLNIREIVVDETTTILGGNMRYLALKKSGAKECTAKIVTGLSPEQKREFVIKDNAGFGEWDFDALANSWSDLPLDDWGIDLPTGWNEKEGEPQIDRAEELNKLWQVKSGDLWQIGEHRLLCGDSTKAEDVKRVMGGAMADMTFIDPPYNALKGRTIPEEQKAMISKTLTGRKLPPERCAASAKAHIGLKRSDEIRANMVKVWAARKQKSPTGTGQCYLKSGFLITEGGLSHE